MTNIVPFELVRNLAVGENQVTVPELDFLYAMICARVETKDNDMETRLNSLKNSRRFQERKTSVVLLKKTFLDALRCFSKTVDRPVDDSCVSSIQNFWG